MNCPADQNRTAVFLTDSSVSSPVTDIYKKCLYLLLKCSAIVYFQATCSFHKMVHCRLNWCKSLHLKVIIFIMSTLSLNKAVQL